MSTRWSSLVCCLWLLVSAGTAQDFPRPPAEIPTDAPGYVGPDTYILPDEEGNPRQFLGLKYEDFVAAWKKSQQLDTPNRQPTYIIESLEMAGATNESHARLTVDVTVSLSTDEPVLVPLRMDRAIVLPPRDQPGTVAPRKLAYDEQRGGLVAWVEGPRDSKQTISLEVLVPLARETSTTALRFKCPRANSSQLTLDVSTTVDQATASRDTILTKSSLRDGGTRLEVAGLAGEFELRWTAEAAPLAELATVLSVSGSIVARIDGRSVQTVANLQVESFGGSFDRFPVRLPPGAELIETGPQEGASVSRAYQIVPWPGEPRSEPPRLATPSDRAGPSSRLYEVQLPEKTTGPVDVQLRVAQPLGLDDERELTAELGGFEVPDAVRQFGELAVWTKDDWRLRWEMGSHIRQVDTAELTERLAGGEPSTRFALAAAFQYDRQPWSLPVSAVPRKTLVRVTPDYELAIQRDDARLRAEFNYQVPGASAFEFRIDLRGWEVTADPIESGGLVDRDRVLLTQDGTLLLRLKEASPRSVRIALRMRRGLDTVGRRLQIPLPTPLVDEVGSGKLNVLAAPGLALTPDLTASAGLAAPLAITHTTAPPSDWEEYEQLPFRTFAGEQVELVADRTFRARETTTQVQAQVTTRPASWQVTQQIDYRVRYEPLQNLSLDVPAGLWADDELTFELLSESGTGMSARTTLEAAPISSDEQGADDDGLRTVRVVLPHPRMGEFRVLVSYQLPRTELAGDATSALSIPLLVPRDGLHDATRVTFTWPTEMAGAVIRPAANHWRLDQAAAATTYETDQPVTELPLTIRRRAPLERPQVNVERAWLQTWFAGQVTQQRVVFRIRTGNSQLAVELPPDVPADQVEVLMDGKLGSVRIDRKRLIVDVPNANWDQLHTIQLRYLQAASETVFARHRVTPPQLVASGPASPLYWQIILPAGRRLVLPPARLEAAGRWDWRTFPWRWRPEMRHSELQSWAAAPESQLSPMAGENEYLLYGLAPIASIEFATVDRWLLMLAASSLVLAVGLGLVYLPVLRNAWFLAGVAVTAGALALAFPETALVFSQLAALGLALAMAGWILHRLLLGRVPEMGPSAGSTASLVRPATLGGASAGYLPQPATSVSAPSALSTHASDPLP